MRRLLASLALLLALVAPAQAALVRINGVDVGNALGTGNATGVTTVALTTTVDAPIGSLIAVVCAGRGSQTWSGVTDSAGNTYSAALANTLTGTQAIRTFFTVNTIDLPLAGTITCTSNLATGQKSTSAIAFSGAVASPLDAASVSQTGTGPPYTVGPTGTLACPGGGSGCEVLVGSETSLNAGVVTPTAGFTTFGSPTSAAAFEFQLVSASTPVTSAPTSTAPSGAYAGNLAAFKAASSGGASGGSGLTTTGVTN